MCQQSLAGRVSKAFIWGYSGAAQLCVFILGTQYLYICVLRGANSSLCCTFKGFPSASSTYVSPVQNHTHTHVYRTTPIYTWSCQTAKRRGKHPNTKRHSWKMIHTFQAVTYPPGKTENVFLVTIGLQWKQSSNFTPETNWRTNWWMIFFYKNEQQLWKCGFTKKTEPWTLGQLDLQIPGVRTHWTTLRPVDKCPLPNEPDTRSIFTHTAITWLGWQWTSPVTRNTLQWTLILPSFQVD